MLELHILQVCFDKVTVDHGVNYMVPSCREGNRKMKLQKSNYCIVATLQHYPITEFRESCQESFQSSHIVFLLTHHLHHLLVLLFFVFICSPSLSLFLLISFFFFLFYYFALSFPSYFFYCYSFLLSNFSFCFFKVTQTEKNKLLCFLKSDH